MVNIGLRVLARPQATMLPEMYRKLGLDFDERVLPSIMNEVSVQILYISHTCMKRNFFSSSKGVQYWFINFTHCVCYHGHCAQLQAIRF